MWGDEQGVAGAKFETAILNTSLISWTDGKKAKLTQQEQGSPPSTPLALNLCYPSVLPNKEMVLSLDHGCSPQGQHLPLHWVH